MFNSPNVAHCITGESRQKTAEQQKDIIENSRNLEEQAISLVGTDIYEKPIKEYTVKPFSFLKFTASACIIRHKQYNFKKGKV
jgi:UDP-galactopyranose mutase